MSKCRILYYQNLAHQLRNIFKTQHVKPKKPFQTNPIKLRNTSTSETHGLWLQFCKIFPKPNWPNCRVPKPNPNNGRIFLRSATEPDLLKNVPASSPCCLAFSKTNLRHAENVKIKFNYSKPKHAHYTVNVGFIRFKYVVLAKY